MKFMRNFPILRYFWQISLFNKIVMKIKFLKKLNLIKSFEFNAFGKLSLFNNNFEKFTHFTETI